MSEAKPDDDFPGTPFTEKETQLLRRMLRDQQRMDWLWASLRVWAGWGAAVSAAVYAGYEPVLRMIKAGLNLK